MSGWHCWDAYVIPSPLACPGCLGVGGERDVAKAEGRLSNYLLSAPQQMALSFVIPVA